jgi:hypothetical protein
VVESAREKVAELKATRDRLNEAIERLSEIS